MTVFINFLFQIVLRNLKNTVLIVQIA